VHVTPSDLKSDCIIRWLLVNIDHTEVSFSECELPVYYLPEAILVRCFVQIAMDLCIIIAHVLKMFQAPYFGRCMAFIHM